MSTAIKQMYRNGASKMRLTFKSTVQPLNHDIRYLSYFNGNIMQSSNNSSNHCCNGHSSHTFCTSNCFCFQSSTMNNSLYNSIIPNNSNQKYNNNSHLTNIQRRMNSTQARESDTAKDINEEKETENQDDHDDANDEQVSESDVEDNMDARIQELEAEAARWKDAAARAQADLFNLDTMSKKDIDKARKYAVKKFSKDILNVADALRGAVDAIENQDMDINDKTKPLIDGVKLTQKTLLETFAKNGITLMDCQGQDFNPNYHEALFTVPTAEHPENTIVQVITQGYEMHDIVLRPAKVGISTAIPQALPPDGDENENSDENKQ